MEIVILCKVNIERNRKSMAKFVNRFKNHEYSIELQLELQGLVLNEDDNNQINLWKSKFRKYAFICVIEDLYKLYKLNYSTYDIAEIYNYEPSQIQKIFQKLGLNRDRFEAQKIAVKKRNYVSIRRSYKRTMLNRLISTQLEGSLLENYVRYEIDLLLSKQLVGYEIIVGINSINVIGAESDIPIIIIRNKDLFKFIVEVDGSQTHKTKLGKNRDLFKDNLAISKDYYIFRIDTKAYFTSEEEPKIKYKNEIQDKLITIVNSIVAIINNKSII